MCSKCSTDTRSAEIGDVGVLVRQEGHDGVNGLLLALEEGSHVHFHGDQRMIADLLAGFEGELVEVVEAEDSRYGTHGLRLLESRF